MPLSDLKLVAYVGEDELTSELGLKQVILSSGRTALVARESKPWIIQDEIGQMIRIGMQAQADQWGKPIYLARYVLEEIVEVIQPKHMQQ